MKTEKLIISFVAILIGVIAAGIAFFIYQATKTLPSSQTQTVTITKPTPSPKPSIFLQVESPEDEKVVTSKTVKINGKTTPEAIIVISTALGDSVISPTTNGDFSTTTVIEDGANQIEITAIGPNGEEASVVRTVSFSTENF